MLWPVTPLHREFTGRRLQIPREAHATSLVFKFAQCDSSHIAARSAGPGILSPPFRSE
jgi:hypothetical protein